MTLDVYRAGMKKLALAFRTDFPPETASVYWEKVKHLSDQQFSLAVESVLDQDDRFPSIARLSRAHLIDGIWGPPRRLA